mgnify:FL=1
MENKVMCPLMGEMIDDAVCFDIHMVVEDSAPNWTAPEKIVAIQNYKEICLNCPNHRD